MYVSATGLAVIIGVWWGGGATTVHHRTLDDNGISVPGQRWLYTRTFMFGGPFGAAGTAFARWYHVRVRIPSRTPYRHGAYRLRANGL